MCQEATILLSTVSSGQTENEMGNSVNRINYTNGDHRVHITMIYAAKFSRLWRVGNNISFYGKNRNYFIFLACLENIKQLYAYKFFFMVPIKEKTVGNKKRI
jgi:hypothetical protein